MAKRRRSFTREFKVQAVRLVTEQHYSFAEAARQLGITENPAPAVEEAARCRGRRSLPRHRQPLSSRSRIGAAPRREQTPPDRARDPKKAAAFFARESS
jgi:transposase